MAKANLLTAIGVRKQKTPGLYPDGNGLYLQVSKGGSKSWLLRYRWQGKRPEIGLGSFADVDLADAREKAAAIRANLRKGVDPRQSTQDAPTEEPTAPTFKACAVEFIKDRRGEWSNAKHTEQWTNTLARYAYPTIGDKPVNEVLLDDVLTILKPLWETKTETATRVRGRVERVLSWAIVKGHRQHPNPALWRGNLDQLLAKPSKIRNSRHFAALPYVGMPDLWTQLSGHTSRTADALRFTILTTARTGEVIAAQWREIDFDAAIWTIPADRMKAKREHRVPLVPAAISLLEQIPRKSDYLFPGLRGNPHLSNMAMLKFLKHVMQRPELTVHGFRSTFKDWAMEATDYPGELSEAQLAHVIANKAQAAYERGDKLERRREMLGSWCDYLESGGNVVSLNSRRAK